MHLLPPGPQPLAVIQEEVTILVSLFDPLDPKKFPEPKEVHPSSTIKFLSVHPHQEITSFYKDKFPKEVF